MEAKQIRNKRVNKEAIIEEAIKRFLKDKGWFVKKLHGNMYQSGMPDLFAACRRYGTRFIEVKCADDYCFTPAQIETFPMLTAQGVGIWILTDANDWQYNLLFKQANWATFIKF